MRNCYQFFSVQKLIYILLLMVLPACAESNSSVSANSSDVSKAASSSTSKKELSDFEVMLEGFPECKFDNVYVDYVSKKPLHDYFLKRNLSPYKLEGELAYFHVDESFMGLSVKEIIIPAGFSVVAIIFEENLATAEKELKDYLVYGYNVELDPMQSNPSIKWVPELTSFHKDKNKSALSCSNSN